MHIYRVDTTIKPIGGGEAETINLLIATSVDDLDVQAIRSEAIESLQALNKTGPNRFMHIGQPFEIAGEPPLPNFEPIRDARHTQTWVVHAPLGL